LIKHLLEQAKKADQYFADEEIKRREDVIMCMKDKWDKQRQLEREIEGKYSVKQTNGTNRGS
jgi:hypothetical protein